MISLLRPFRRIAFPLLLSFAVVGCSTRDEENPDEVLVEDAGVSADAGENQACTEGEIESCELAEGCLGTRTCEGGTFTACVAPPERCDGVDNDCDGEVDENFTNLGEACTAGVGACEAAGVMVCDAAGGSVVCNAVEGEPSAELCDGVDNDCDGEVDEDFTSLSEACTSGVGACEAAGVMVCDVGGEGVACNAVAGEPSAEICDGVDNDCDGTVDNVAGLGTACSVGTGSCEASGTRVCDVGAGALVCNVSPGSPSTEVCDGVDNDCDGTVDNVAGVGTACSVGTGACQASGTRVCNTGTGSLVCNATAGSPSAEVCDGLDNDCDGTIDEITPAFAQVTYSADRGCSEIALGHIDNDGHLDIVCAMALDSGTNPDTRLAYFLSTGPGTYGAVQYTSPVAVSPFRSQSDVAFGDIDGDGRADLVAVGETMKAQVYRNTGSGFAAPVEAFNFSSTFEHGTSGLALTDFNGDGRLDIVTTIGTVRDANSWRLAVATGTSSGTFNSPIEFSATTNGRATEIAIGDVDADGDLDALVLTTDAVLVYRRQGSTFNAPEVLISGLGAVEEFGYADANGDGRADLLIPQSGSVRIYPAQGTGFGAPVMVATPWAANSARFMSYDCDATPEAVVAPANVGARPMLFAEPATLSDAYTLPSPNAGAFTVEVGDLDGDGRDDLILGRLDSGIWVMLRQP